MRLRAPLNFDIAEEEPVLLEIQGPKSATVTLTEASRTSKEHTGRIPLRELGAEAIDKIQAVYGFGYMATKAEIVTH